MRLGVIDYIDSAHYLPGHGKCGRIHGHTYKIEVIIEGEVRESGMVIDFYDLKKGIKETLQEYDHKLLNEILEFPSSEHLCLHIHSRLLEKYEKRCDMQRVFYKGNNSAISYSLR